MNCYQGYCLENPSLLYLIIPIGVLLGFFLFMDLIRFRSKGESKEFRKRKRGLRTMVLVLRIAMAFFILVAFASPFTTYDKISHGDPVIKLLVDNSYSMDVFDDRLTEKVTSLFGGKVPLDMKQIAAGGVSNLGESILQNMDGGDNLLILSDGNSNGGRDLVDVGIYSRISDTRLFAFTLAPSKTDAWVTLDGPSQTIGGTLNTFTAKVSYVGNEPAFTLQIYVDDSLEFSGQNIFEKKIVKSFPVGAHKISAKIVLADHFPDNNVFYKSIKSIEKPKILFVSPSDSPLESGIKGIYDVTVSRSLARDISPYDAIVLNDVPYSLVKSRIEDLTGYLLEGNGLLFIGGAQAFDRGGYEGTVLEGLLPVRMGTGRIIDPFHHNIIIVLDVSDSFTDYGYKEGSQATTLDLGKGMATKMIENFRDDISVGIVAFASIGQVVSMPVPLSEGREELIGKIERLKGGQGTSIDQGFIMAERALSGVRGTKNVILISDGKMGNVREPHAPKMIAQRLADAGTTIYTVGLPSLLNSDSQTINRPYMKILAGIGNGQYFEPDDSQYLNVFFGKPEAKEKIFSGTSNLAVVDRDHFITKGIDLDVSITGLNFVVPKPGSRSLVFTADSNPVINAWGFGLGRVVTLATDDGREWAGDLLARDNSEILSRMINYAIGNPEKGKDISIYAQDSYLGDESNILVRSSKYPVSKDLVFTKQNENLYKAAFNPEKPGFYQFFDAIVAINPPREYYLLGQNPSLLDMVSASGGRMLDLAEGKEIAKEIQSLTERAEKQRKDLSLYPLGVMLLLYLIEVFIRI